MSKINADIIAQLMELPPKRRLKQLMQDPEAGKLARSFSPQEYYLTIKEVGETDAIELISYASFEQIKFCLDLELWEKWNFRPDQAYRWLKLLTAAGEDKLVSIMLRLDPELLQLMFMEELEVGGENGAMTTDEIRFMEWDHSFDDIFFFNFRNEKHARLIGTILDILFRLHQPLYRSIMESCFSSMKSELEDESLKLRTGRLADFGFPEYSLAIEIYAPIAPENYTLKEAKEHAIDSTEGILILPTGHGNDDSLLSRILNKVMTEELRQELGYLLNCAMIAENGNIPDKETVKIVKERVYGWLNIALEHLAGTDEAKAAEIIKRDYLKRLFRLGCGIVKGVSRKAKSAQSDNYATKKALKGFIADRPKFYRALDPDHADGYREFKTLVDIQKAEELLALINQGN